MGSNFAKHKITTEAWTTTVKKKNQFLTGIKITVSLTILSLLGHP